MSHLIGVENDLVREELVLNWQDRPAQRFSHAWLRSICPCAFCRADRLRGRSVGSSAGIHVTGWQSMGYGLQLRFSDGHDRGIFPWVFLTELESGGTPPRQQAGTG